MRRGFTDWLSSKDTDVPMSPTSPAEPRDVPMSPMSAASSDSGQFKHNVGGRPAQQGTSKAAEPELPQASDGAPPMQQETSSATEPEPQQTKVDAPVQQAPMTSVPEKGDDAMSQVSPASSADSEQFKATDEGQPAQAEGPAALIESAPALSTVEASKQPEPEATSTVGPNVDDVDAARLVKVKKERVLVAIKKELPDEDSPSEDDDDQDDQSSPGKSSHSEKTFSPVVPRRLSRSASVSRPRKRSRAPSPSASPSRSPSSNSPKTFAEAETQTTLSSHTPYDADFVQRVLGVSDVERWQYEKYIDKTIERADMLAACWSGTLRTIGCDDSSIEALWALAHYGLEGFVEANSIISKLLKKEADGAKLDKPSAFVFRCTLTARQAIDKKLDRLCKPQDDTSKSAAEWNWSDNRGWGDKSSWKPQSSWSSKDSQWK